MDWQFDENNFVKPYTCITISLKEFFEKFVSEMEQGKRREIFDQYQSLLKVLRR